MLTMVVSISGTVCLLNEMREVFSLPDLLLTLRITAQLDGGITGFVLPSSKRQQLSHPRKTNLLLSSWQTLDLAEKEKRRVLSSSHGRAQSWGIGHLCGATVTQVATTLWPV